MAAGEGGDDDRREDHQQLPCLRRIEPALLLNVLVYIVGVATEDRAEHSAEITTGRGTGENSPQPAEAAEHPARSERGLDGRRAFGLLRMARHPGDHRWQGALHSLLGRRLVDAE